MLLEAIAAPLNCDEKAIVAVTTPNLDDNKQAAFLKALRSTRTVVGTTHTYYRYPARFSPEFARESVSLFTKPGDTVLDPFMGGGTSAVEAIASGRNFIGSDINPLACFVSRVKTTPLSSNDVRVLRAWTDKALNVANLRRLEPRYEQWAQYQKNVPWRTRRVLAQILDFVDELELPRQQRFARCSVLRTAQWALDCKSSIPSTADTLLNLEQTVSRMFAGNDELRRRLRDSRHAAGPTSCKMYCIDASILASDQRVARNGKPTLILTSPPYMGVHVLYHRWQVLGRRETSAPYWIVDKPDGHGGSYYTFADRKSVAQDRYLEKLRACFRSLASLMSQRTLIVQLVAFPDADIQLPIYLKALADVGLQHCESLDTAANQSTLAREVPNRRWYALLNKQSTSSREFLLIHRLGTKRRGAHEQRRRKGAT